ncbi:MAG: hypothetical protein MI975_19050 [Cytophagales bacterium]|nr:hypothetical protein [Cytophagales bacterium]
MINKINYLFVIKLLLTKSLLLAQDYDSPTGAIEVPHQENWASGVDAYTTVGATNQPPVTCGGLYDRWFKFTAISTFMELNFNSSTNERTIWFDLWDESLSNALISCYITSTTGRVTYDQLSIGSTYYISVNQDNNTIGPFGFSLSSKPSYDFPIGALEVPHVDNWASGVDAYTTIGATNQPPVTCGGLYDRWFKFTATSTYIELNFNSSTSERTIWFDLWDESLSNALIPCYITSTTSGVTYDQLSIGSTYYISVNQDNNTIGPFGFSISGGTSRYWMLSENVLSPVVLGNKIGINTREIPPDFQLAIDGKAIMEEVKVQHSENWPDFVFENDYSLRALEEVENYINEHKHLPEIPNKEEVTENGVNLGEMNAKLLQKLEELTLYLIEQNYELKAQKDQNKAQQNLINELQKRIEKLEKDKN